jgi:D-alanine-D-alanine ligase-like ATP-grasp enzyme
VSPGTVVQSGDAADRNPDGEFVVLEVSAVPGMTATSLFPFSVQPDGGSFSSTLGFWLKAAIARTQ